jgi:hypothetical protein
MKQQDVERRRMLEEEIIKVYYHACKASKGKAREIERNLFFFFDS